MKSRVFSTDDGAAHIKQKESRLREMVRRRYVAPERLSNGVLVWDEVSLEVVRICARAIDARGPQHCVRALAARLVRLPTVEAIRRYAAGCTIYEDQGLFKLADGNLDAQAVEIAKMAEHKITFTEET